MLNHDIDDIKFSEVVKLVSSLDAERGDWEPFKIAFLRNITMDPVVPYTKFLCYQEGLKPAVYMGDYDNVIQEVTNPHSALFHHTPDAIVLCLKIETLAETFMNNFLDMSAGEISDESARIINLIDTILTEIRKNSQATIFVHSFETPAFPPLGILDYQDQFQQVNTVRNINLDVVDLLRKYEGVYLVDIDLLRSVIGYSRFIDQRYWHIGRAPYTREAWKLIAKEYMKFIRALKGKNKKCLVLDCDNTLWGGIVGEEGINNIKVGTTYPGSTFREFQQAILNLHNRGVMLAICSKNNERDVLDVLEKHPDMVLRKNHFVAIRANWNDKVANLTEIADDLNVGLDSFVFVDDSDFEINMVKTILPEVKTIKLSGDPSSYKDTLISCGWFDSLTFSHEDRSRSKLYRAEKERRQARETFHATSLHDYLRYLEMEVSIRSADDFSIPRVAQLTQRTNQFNLTTKRYSENDIRELALRENAEVRLLHLKDRFGESGLVATAILKYAGKDCIIDSFLLSCRVIGRGIEDILLVDSINRARARSCERLIGEYMPTKKNGQVADFYQGYGFKQLGECGEVTKYFLPLSGPVAEIPSHFKCIRIDDTVLDVAAGVESQTAEEGA